MDLTIEPIFVLQWMLLEEVPEWDAVSTCLESLKNVISFTVFYNQFYLIKDIVKSEIAANKDTWKSQSCVEKSLGIFDMAKESNSFFFFFSFSQVPVGSWKNMDTLVMTI